MKFVNIRSVLIFVLLIFISPKQRKDFNVNDKTAVSSNYTKNLTFLFPNSTNSEIPTNFNKFELLHQIKFQLEEKLTKVISTFQAELKELSSNINQFLKNSNTASTRFLQEDKLSFIKQLSFLLTKNRSLGTIKQSILGLIDDIIPKNYNASEADGFLCRPCHLFINGVDKIISKEIFLKMFEKLLTQICELTLSDQTQCGDSMDKYGQIIYESIIDHYLDAEFICTLIRVCDNHYVPLKIEDYAKEVLRDKPKNIDPPSFPSNRTLRVLHLSDIHIDPEYKINSESDCGQPFCCRDTSSEMKSPAGFWGSVASCDLPVHTLSSLVETLSEEIKPDLVLWTGDNASHDVWKVSEDAAAIATRIIGSQLHVNLTEKNSIPLFPAIGNHEERIVDLFNPYDASFEQPLLKNISEVYSMFLSEEKTGEFYKKGYYSEIVSGTKLRIIAINCFLCDSMNFYLLRNPTDPWNQIDALRKTLQSAEDAGEKVFIIGHIPPGDTTYMNECNLRYNVLMERYQNIIRGQFYGHTHNDEIRLLRSFYNKTDFIGEVFIAPSTTT